MTTPDGLLAELQTRGIVLRRAGADRLMARDPHKALTPGLKRQISKYKIGLLALLAAPVDVSQLSLASALSAAEAEPETHPCLAVEVWPADPAHVRLLWRLLSNPATVEFYAADRDLCKALDREDAAAIAAAQVRFDRALIHARYLATKVLNAAK